MVSRLWLGHLAASYRETRNQLENSLDSLMIAIPSFPPAREKAQLFKVRIAAPVLRLLAAECGCFFAEEKMANPAFRTVASKTGSLFLYVA